ncbi:hypothetical protein [Nakamurella alba]|uniref:hypothetical protein n=1 Tax=Nakamurella alba TaxID=2665158 RepID=UPI0012B9667A|nr:hypothetical protein [Nakamurella alba]
MGELVQLVDRTTVVTEELAPQQPLPCLRRPWNEPEWDAGVRGETVEIGVVDEITLDQALCQERLPEIVVRPETEPIELRISVHRVQHPGVSGPASRVESGDHA